MSLPIDNLTSSGFNGKIILPDEEAWVSSTQTWGSQGKLSPKLALQPSTSEDVSKALIWLNECKLDFAVRSGGLGESQSNDVILDLANFNTAEYIANDNLFYLGPGQTWNELYGKLADKDVTVLGGRVGFVGVGGFTLGGGLSFLANKHGLASDSLVDAEVVLANGRIVRAKDHADLLFALKGAGHAFGVVTELVVKAYPKPKSVFGGVLLYSIDKFSELSERMTHITDSKVNIMMGVARMPPDMHPTILVVPMVYESAEYAKKALHWAWELGPLQDWCSSMTFEQSVKTQELYVQRPPAGATFQQHNLVVSQLTPNIMKAGLEWQTELQKDPRFFGAALLFEPFYPGAFASEDSKSAWPHSSPTLHIINVLIEERNTAPGHVEENSQHLRACIEAMEKAAEPGTVLPKYPNYSLAGIPASAYYERNLTRLQQIKKRLDPDNRFNKGIQIVI